MNPGHCTNFSKQSQQNMEAQNNAVMEFTNDPKLDNFMIAVRNMYYGERLWSGFFGGLFFSYLSGCSQEIFKGA